MRPAFVKSLRRVLVPILVLAALGGAACAARDYLRAVVLLMDLEHATGDSWSHRLGVHKVVTSEFTIASPEGPLRCRLYSPAGRPASPSLVLIHGVHMLGIDEPRLVHFATIFTQRGITMLTPEIRSLKDYRLDPAAIDEIGTATYELHRRTGEPVGLMGLSFAGGLSLLTAADPRYSPDISFVVSVGGHDDLPRVAHFLVTGQAELPDGAVENRPVEQYGALVLVYDHAEDFFSAADGGTARAAIRSWLAEDYSGARRQESALSPAGRERLEMLFRYQLDPLRPEFLDEIARRAPEMEQVSPHGKLAALRVPVFVLHGSDDAVIPSSEALWLARDVPANQLRDLLITRAISHVEANNSAGLRSRWRLVAFIAQLFRALESERPPRLQSKVVVSGPEERASSH